VKLGLGLPQSGGVSLRTDIVDVARAAETGGYSSLWVYERLLCPAPPRNGRFGLPGLEWPTGQQDCADPLCVLAVAAVVTDTVRLGANVLTAGLHLPVPLAKALATIDLLSGGGRLVAGLGIGFSDEELRAVGSTLAEGAGKLDETLDVLQAVWGEDPVTYHGRWSHLDRVLVQPKPLSHIPVMLDGTGGEHLTRIARRAGGWLPAGHAPEKVSDTWTALREAVARNGRNPGAMEMIYRAPIELTDRPGGPERRLFEGNVPQIVEDIWVCQDSGVTELVVELQFRRPGSTTLAVIETALDIRELAVTEGLLTDASDR
jgi:probable F420-dependent oxidoreductase